MLAMFRLIGGRIVKVAKLVVGLLVGAMVICGFGQLFAVGSVAGVVVAAACWVVQRGWPALLAGIGAVIESAGVLGAAIGILLGLLLLGVAKLAADAAGALMEPIVAGYRTVRPAPPPAAA